jgi:hypothetical protein
MKTSHISLAALIALIGCNVFRRDLIGAGVYRLETVGVIGCEVSATAVEKDRKLHIDGFIRGVRLTTPLDGELLIFLRMPDGTESRRGRVEIRPVGHRRTGHSHPRFEAVIDELPPAGTVIKALPRFPRCLPASPRAADSRVGEK